MKYNKFIIKGYRGISDETVIDISKESLIPIIGKNESGKTTCLQAINAFDFNNDKDSGGRHLNNVANLYSTSETPIIVAAEIQLDPVFNLKEIFQSYFDVVMAEYSAKYPNAVFDLQIIKDQDNFTNWKYLKAYQILAKKIEDSDLILIERDLRLMQYNLPVIPEIADDTAFIKLLAETLLMELPYILYFDDFRDRMEEKVYITNDETAPSYSSWILYIDELFKQTKKDYSVFTISGKQDSTRRSIIAEVQKFLNKTLTEEWSKYQFEKNDDIEIRIEYVQADVPFLHFKIVEKVYIENKLEERYFDISDRSKGFFWYFNFMIKLHFNPTKRDNNDMDTVYLLDEPGSYLHTYALNKLAEQLKSLSIKNKVIYCTHFHNLLNPEFIPINSIRVAAKINQGKITLSRLNEADLNRTIKNSAFQPILDALEVKPPMLEYDLDNIILVEGIYDYYSFRMFTSEFFVYFPCVSASSIVNQISYMIFLKKKYLAIWDDDEEGRSRYNKAIELFGDVESKRFLLLNSIDDKKNTRIEEYYDQAELNNFNKDHIGSSTVSFNRVVLKLFYEPNRKDLIKKYFPLTSLNFDKMESVLKGKIEVGFHSGIQIELTKN